MAQTFAKFAKFFRPICKNSGDIVAVKLHDRSITIAGIDIKSNIIHLENLASMPLPRAVEWQHLACQQEMIYDSLSSLRDQGLFVASDADLESRSIMKKNSPRLSMAYQPSSNR